jgi:hypothetical protein
MRRVFTSIAPTVVTGIAGLMTLVSFFNFLLPGFLQPDLISLRISLIDIAVIVAGVAMVMGFLHLLYTHVRRLRRRQSTFYSLVLIGAALITLVLLILDRAAPPPDRVLTRFIFNDLIVPLQSALGALLAVFLALAAVRTLQHRRGAGAVWFLLAALVVLITQVPLPLSGGLADTLTVVRSFLDAATTGGLRGLLLGVALGTLATAFRVLFFIDRPQSE